MPSPLLSVADLRAHLDDSNWIVIDCRFSLDDPEAGRDAYANAHIPGARYAHLNKDLSGPIHAGVTGRHPLPDPITFGQQLSEWGVNGRSKVVAYDDAGGAIASRLWWMLRWIGHEDAYVLDGGWQAWTSTDAPVSRKVPRRRASVFVARVRPGHLADESDVQAVVRGDAEGMLLDARAPERFRGEHEPIDPIAGHIEGACSTFFRDNLDEDGFFLPPDVLKARYEEILGDYEPSQAIAYCGSGVTACHTLLAMAHAGLPGARLYAGSWSEWILGMEG